MVCALFFPPVHVPAHSEQVGVFGDAFHGFVEHEHAGLDSERYGAGVVPAEVFFAAGHFDVGCWVCHVGEAELGVECLEYGVCFAVGCLVYPVFVLVAEGEVAD